MNRDLLQAQLLLHEGFRSSAYRDSLGYLTIGIGRQIDSRAGGGITKDEALYLLSNDIDGVTEALSRQCPWWLGLDDVRQRVIADMAFNMGVRKFLTFESLIAAVKVQAWPEAAHQMLNSRWATQVGRRALRLAEMMRSGIDVRFEDD